MTQPLSYGRMCLATLVVFSCLGSPPVPVVHAQSKAGTVAEDKPSTFHSKFLDDDVLILLGVFVPTTAERRVLPFMEAERDRFPGSTVLDIGTGSGIIALYAAKLGAAKVIATDIDSVAIECTRLNAERLGFGNIIEPRLVSPEDMSAYAVIRPGERFDFIVSNPPYILDIDVPTNSEWTDSGDLGFSIIRDLDKRLSPGGEAVLLYGSTFYHQIIVKFARHLGYEVRNYDPEVLYRPEVLALWNSYLRRLLEREGLGPDEFRFDQEDVSTLVPRVRQSRDTDSNYPGIIVIRNADSHTDTD